MWSPLLSPQHGGLPHVAAPVPRKSLDLIPHVPHLRIALNMAVFLLIGKTSALTMNIAGVVKDWMLIALSVILFG